MLTNKPNCLKFRSTLKRRVCVCVIRISKSLNYTFHVNMLNDKIIITLCSMEITVNTTTLRVETMVFTNNSGKLELT